MSEAHCSIAVGFCFFRNPQQSDTNDQSFGLSEYPQFLSIADDKKVHHGFEKFLILKLS
jgi:hypothetical protein